MECKGNQRTVFVVPKIIISNKNMAHDFNKCFYQKVNNIHSSLCSWLVKKCQAELTKVIRNIVNISPKAGVFPQIHESCPVKAFNKEI